MNLRNLFTKADILLIIGCVILNGLSIAWIYRPQKPGGRAIIEVDDRVAGVYPLDQPQERITVHGKLGPAEFRIEGGVLWAVSAPCPEKICMQMGRISRGGELIVCVPNRVLARIENPPGAEDEGQLDGISR